MTWRISPRCASGCWNSSTSWAASTGSTEELAGLARADRLFVDPEKAHERLRWSGELDADRARLLQRLAAWRERRAMEKDRPRSWILEDAALRALVLQVPRTPLELGQIAGARRRGSWSAAVRPSCARSPPPKCRHACRHLRRARGRIRKSPRA